MTVGAPAPLQEAGAVALRLPDSYYEDLASTTRSGATGFWRCCEARGLNAFVPKGAYYIMCDIGTF